MLEDSEFHGSGLHLLEEAVVHEPEKLGRSRQFNETDFKMVHFTVLSYSERIFFRKGGGGHEHGVTTIDQSGIKVR